MRSGAMSAEEWDREGFTPEGPGPYRQFMEIRVFDCWFHDQDIREALGRPGFVDGPVADLSIGRIPGKALGYVVGKKAGAPPGSTVVFEVTGTPPIIAAIEVPPEGRARLLDVAPDAPDRARRHRPQDVRPSGRRPLERRPRPGRGLGDRRR